MKNQLLVRGVFYITPKQKEVIKKNAKKRKWKESEVLRDILDKEFTSKTK